MRKRALKRRYGHSTVTTDQVKAAWRAWQRAAQATWGRRVTSPVAEERKHARIVALKEKYEALARQAKGLAP